MWLDYGPNIYSIIYNIHQALKITHLGFYFKIITIYAIEWVLIKQYIQQFTKP